MTALCRISPRRGARRALQFMAAPPHQCRDTNFSRPKALSDGGCDTEDVASPPDRAVRYAIGGIEAFAATAANHKTPAKASWSKMK